MCVDKKIAERMRKGVKIDAEFPRNMELANCVLQREGYNPKIDYLHVNNQYENQLTRVRYLKTVTIIDEKTGERYEARHFEIQMPDRYIPAKKAPKGAIRSKQDIF